jgi:ABC-type multidrug transport system ATPase subunit
MIHAINVGKKFGNKTVLNDVTFDINDKGIYGIVGPNGSGKTTLFRMITNLSKATSGEFRINAKKIGALIEAPTFYENLSAKKNLQFIATALNIESIHIVKALETVGLTEVQNQKVSRFSYGMKQRLGIAQAILGQPDLLILDEPTNGLDVENTLKLRSLLKELSKVMPIIISSHQMSELELLCDWIGIFKDGQLYFKGTVDELINLSADKRIIFELSTNKNDLAMDYIKDLIIEASQIEGKLLVEVHHQYEIRTIIRTLVENNIDIDHVQRLKMDSLESTFSKIVNL